MTANDLREMQRDLEAGREVDRERLRRAVEFAADIAESAEDVEWEPKLSLADTIAEASFRLHKEVP